MIKRLFIACIVFIGFLLLIMTPIETLIWSIRYVVTGKSFPDYPIGLQIVYLACKIGEL